MNNDAEIRTPAEMLERDAARLLDKLMHRGYRDADPSDESVEFVTLLVAAAAMRMQKWSLKQAACEPTGENRVSTGPRNIADRLSDRADELAYGNVRAPQTEQLLYEGAAKMRRLIIALKAMLAEYRCCDRECEDLADEALASAEEKS